jgi:hypothetical protein
MRCFKIISSLSLLSFFLGSTSLGAAYVSEIKITMPKKMGTLRAIEFYNVQGRKIEVQSSFIKVEKAPANVGNYTIECPKGTKDLKLIIFYQGNEFITTQYLSAQNLELENFKFKKEERSVRQIKSKQGDFFFLIEGMDGCKMPLSIECNLYME